MHKKQLRRRYKVWGGRRGEYVEEVYFRSKHKAVAYFNAMVSLFSKLEDSYFHNNEKREERKPEKMPPNCPRLGWESSWHFVSIEEFAYDPDVPGQGQIVETKMDIARKTLINKFISVPL